MAQESKTIRSEKKSRKAVASEKPKKSSGVMSRNVPSKEKKEESVKESKRNTASKKEEVAVKKTAQKPSSESQTTGKPATSSSAPSKKRLIVSYHNLSPELFELFRKKYAAGYLEHVIKVTAPNDKVFYAVTLDTPDASYLVKVDVKIDTLDEDDLIEPTFGEDDTLGSGVDEADGFTATTDEDIENIPPGDDE